MAKRNQNPRKAAMRKMMGEFLRENDISLKDGADVNSLMREMMAALIEETLDGELDDKLGYDRYDYENKETDNSRNGHSQKTMHTSYGDMEVDIPRDRKGEYSPQLIPKYATTLTKDMEDKILSMYAKGMTTGDIESHMKDLYGVDISDSTISRITDRVMPLVKVWQERPLEEVYAVVYMDAIHYHVRSEGRIVKRAVYVAIGIDMSGKKDVLGMYVGENESARFWRFAAFSSASSALICSSVIPVPGRAASFLALHPCTILIRLSVRSMPYFLQISTAFGFSSNS